MRLLAWQNNETVSMEGKACCDAFGHMAFIDCES